MATLVILSFVIFYKKERTTHHSVMPHVHCLSWLRCVEIILNYL